MLNKKQAKGCNVFILLVVLSLFYRGASFCAQPLEQKSGKYNILLIIIDALRADHLPCYGYNLNNAPNIGAFAKKSVLFKQTITQAPNTLLSFSSIFTSQNVATHGVDRIDKCLGDSALTLAEILKIYNYQTAFFGGGRLLHPDFGLNQGFDTYVNLMKLKSSFRDTVPLALNWLAVRENKDKNFFLVIHGNDLHPPYPPMALLVEQGKGIDAKSKNKSLGNKNVNESIDGFTIYKRKLLLKGGESRILKDDEVNNIIKFYDNKIKDVDEVIGELLKRLRKLKLFDNTCIILTADHGEGLFDHDFFFHDFNLYETTLKVPLIISMPGCKPKEISSSVQLIDIMPTILDILKIPVNQVAEGKSLLPLLNDGNIQNFHEFIFSQTPHGEISIRTDAWKLIYYDSKRELYNLYSDPGERNNLANINKEVSESLGKKLHEWFEYRKQNSHTVSILNSNKFLMGIVKLREKNREELYQFEKSDLGLN